MLRWMLPAALLLAVILAAWPLAASVAVPTLAPTADADGGPTVHGVASELMCQCGCALTVAACQESMECSVAESMVQDIQRRIDAGESKQEILNSFASVYGEQVLAMPRKSGFSLTAWVIPFLAVAAGGVVISVVVRAWVRQRSAPAAAEAPGATVDALDLYEQRVDEELRLLE